MLFIIPHNLTNKFQPLDVTVNKPAKSFIANKYNGWFANEITKQLGKGIKLADVKVLSSKLYMLSSNHYMRNGLLMYMNVSVNIPKLVVHSLSNNCPFLSSKDRKSFHLKLVI